MGWTLITGAADRLGATISKILAKKGHNVLIHYRSSRDLAEAVRDVCRGFDVKAEIVQGDFSTEESTMEFIRSVKGQYPDIHNIVNNVGNIIHKSALETTTEEWMNLFQVNLHTPFLIIKECIESVKEKKGHIINIGVSGLGKCSGSYQNTAYSLTKHSLWILTRSLAKELAGDQVPVNMVSPGQLEISVDLPEDTTTLPMKRAGTTEEVARVIAFLLQNESEYITGQNIDVAGGYGL